MYALSFIFLSTVSKFLSMVFSLNSKSACLFLILNSCCLRHLRTCRYSLAIAPTTTLAISVASTVVIIVSNYPPLPTILRLHNGVKGYIVLLIIFNCSVMYLFGIYIFSGKLVHELSVQKHVSPYDSMSRCSSSIKLSAILSNTPS